MDKMWNDVTPLIQGNMTSGWQGVDIGTPRPWHEKPMWKSYFEVINYTAWTEGPTPVVNMMPRFITEYGADCHKQTIRAAAADGTWHYTSLWAFLQQTADVYYNPL